MRQFSFSLANQQDDAQLRALIQATPMEGRISIAFQREPDYFYAAKTEGKFNQTIMARESEHGNVIGMGSRSIKPAFVNGKVSSLGYLSSLRIHKDYRNHTLLSRGYHALKKLHEDKQVKAYVSTVISDNTQAINLLTAGSDGLPKYRDFGIYHTYAIELKKPPKIKSKRVKIIKGSQQNLDEIVECLRRNGRDKQFYPYYENEDFKQGSEFLRDFKKENFYVAVTDSKIVGVLGKWDQSAFKQIVICGYDKKLNRIRPAYNFLADFLNVPRLPPPESKLNAFYVGFIAVDNNNPEIFSDLLSSIYKDHVGSAYEYIIIGLFEQDLLTNAVEKYPHIKYKIRVFVVCWDDGKEWFQALDNRIPYLEVATL